MANGKIHDHPISDILYYGLTPLPEDLNDLVRRLNALDPKAFKYPQERPDNIDWFAVEKGFGIQEARAFLQSRIAEAEQ